MGWRSADTPLWSFERFIRSPRGLKAAGIGAVTWTAYEFVEIGIDLLVAAAGGGAF